MDTGTIARLLTNAGFNVKGIDASQTHILLEDPSCILRNFETFIEYAWIIVTLITAIMLFGWGVSKIRGANTDIVTNIRNLVIMFGVLSAAGPIINLIYGGDLLARTCHIIQVPIADVQQVLDARNARMSPNDDLFEGIDIFDSGVRAQGTTNPDFEPVDVPNVTFQQDPETGEIVPVFDDDDIDQTPDDRITAPETPNIEYISTPPQPVSAPVVPNDSIPEHNPTHPQLP